MRYCDTSSKDLVDEFSLEYRCFFGGFGLGASNDFSVYGKGPDSSHSWLGYQGIGLLDEFIKLVAVEIIRAGQGSQHSDVFRYILVNCGRNVCRSVEALQLDQIALRIRVVHRHPGEQRDQRNKDERDKRNDPETDCLWSILKDTSKSYQPKLPRAVGGGSSTIHYTQNPPRHHFSIDYVLRHEDGSNPNWFFVSPVTIHSAVEGDKNPPTPFENRRPSNDAGQEADRQGRG